ncbi:hypothetical protein BDV11DRAFT_165791 [Aspergillus similis]
MDQEHGGTSQWEWVCQTCRQKNINFAFNDEDGLTSHIKYQHSEGIKSHHIPMLLSAWRRKVPLEVSTCPLCGFEGDGQTTALDHAAEHVHSFALLSLPWKDDEGENNGHQSYFQRYPYFEVSGSEPDLSSGSHEVSSLASIPNSHSDDLSESLSTAGDILTEDALGQIPDDALGWTGTETWLRDLEHMDRSASESKGTLDSGEMHNYEEAETNIVKRSSESDLQAEK